MASLDERLWLALAVQWGFVKQQDVERVLSEVKPVDAKAPLALRFVRRGLLSEEDLSALTALAARASRVHPDASAALAFASTHLPQPTAPWLSLAETVKSGEHPRPIDSLEGLDFVVPELAGRYGREAELGRGGIGRVVSTRDEVVGREVAMKQLLPERSAEAAKDTVQSVTLQARFLREARLAAQLEHPGIVPVYEVGRRPDGSLYYTMRRIRGRTLADAVKEAKAPAERLRLVANVLTVAQALAYAHSRGVLHRDVKPQNVMLGSFGETYLLDWGLARLKGKGDAQDFSMAPDITGGAQPGAVGTPSYMSPEQALGRVAELDERTDVWGLGAVLYEVLTGRPPYVGKTAIDVIQQVVGDDWTPVPALVPDAPPDLVAVVDKALAKEPSRRYPSAKELALDLEAWLQGRRVSAREYSGVDLFLRLVRRNRVASGLVSAALLAVLVVGTVSWQRIREQRNEARAFASFLLTDIAPGLYSVAGAEELVERLAKASARFVGQASWLGLEDVAAQTALARAWFILGSASFNAGRIDEGERFTADCLRLVGEDQVALRTSPSRAAVMLHCLVLRVRLEEMTSGARGQRSRVDELRRFVEEARGPWPQSAEWNSARSDAYTRLFRLLLPTEPPAALKYLDRALALDEEAHVNRYPSADASLVASLRDAELVEWIREEPGPALARGERALAIARRSPRRLQNGPLLRAWVGVLTQHLMLLEWSGRPEEGPKLVEEGERVVEQLMSLEPDRTTTRGVVADFYLQVGRPAEAQALLATELEKGVGADYLTSYLLAAFLAGDDAAVLAQADQLERAKDPQGFLLLGLALARTGKTREAAALLRQWAEHILQTALQWPRGAFAHAGRRASPAVAPLLDTFFAKMEAALPVDDQKAQAEALEALARGLDAP